MMNCSPTCAQPTQLNLPQRQRGVVIVITLIILAAMTLGALVMMRATDTATLIAGNLAFKQSTINSSNIGAEIALKWLQDQQQANSSNLYYNMPTNGYLAQREDPDYRSAESWDAFWQRLQAANETCAVSISADTPPVISCGTTPTADASGNTVSYVIHRMCPFQSTTLDPNAGSPFTPGSGCSVAVAKSNLSSDKAAGGQELNNITQVYYRVTLRVAGPNNTVTYTQVNTAL